jgi:DNA-binding transcriptional LysR family regulator
MEGSFTRAALRMHVSQPSLSRQVRALAKEVGGELLERLPRSVRLTAAGKALLPQAQIAVRTADRAMQAARSALELETATPARSSACMSHAPLAAGGLRTRRVACGASAPPPIDWAGPVRRLGWEEFLVVLSPEDLLASWRKLRLVELIASACASAGFTPRHRCSRHRTRAHRLCPRTVGPLGAAFVELMAETRWAKPPRGALVVP